MIVLDHLKAGYMGSPVIEIEHQVFETGKITSLIGKNGSGKSTLLKAIIGLLKYSGSLTIDGKERNQMSDKERARQVAYLPQSLTAPDMDVLTLVSHGRYARLGFSRTLNDADKKAIRDAMDVTDVTGLSGRSLKSLSGGERQRAYLAMTIAQDTQILLLDEPATYMDVAHQARITQILKTLAADGKGIILASHDLQQSFSISDRLCIMDGGRIRACDTPQALAEKPQVMRSALGVTVAACDDARFLYPYVLAK